VLRHGTISSLLMLLRVLRGLRRSRIHHWVRGRESGRLRRLEDPARRVDSGLLELQALASE
jgi:hypothetical protein